MFWCYKYATKTLLLSKKNTEHKIWQKSRKISCFLSKKLKRIGNALDVVKWQISRRSADQKNKKKIVNALGVVKRQIWRQSAEIAGLLQKLQCNKIPFIANWNIPDVYFLKDPLTVKWAKTRKEQCSSYSPQWTENEKIVQ